MRTDDLINQVLKKVQHLFQKTNYIVPKNVHTVQCFRYDTLVYSFII